MTGTEILAHIEAGDSAWWEGERKSAVAAWRRALNADPSPEGRAAEAMARIRLLLVSGNLGPFWHERAMNQALAACPVQADPCALAWADREIYLPTFTGADPTRVATILGGRVDPAAAHRLTIAAEGTRPENPGTWVFSVGVGGAPGAGFGVTTRFLHPDLAWKAHRLDITAGLDTLGGGAIGASIQSATRPSWHGAAAVSRTVGWLWVDDQPTLWRLDSARLSGGAGVASGATRLQLGGTARADDVGPGPDFVAGPHGTLTVSGGTATARLSVDTGFGAYTHLGIGIDLRVGAPVLGGTLAARAGASVVPTESPFYRLPTAGGATLLRGAPAGRWRDAEIASAQVEYRHEIWGPLHAAAFVDSAQVDGWHLTAGGGLRIVLPPEPFNTARVDIGFGAGGWGVVVGMGEAF